MSDRLSTGVCVATVRGVSLGLLVSFVAILIMGVATIAMAIGATGAEPIENRKLANAMTGIARDLGTMAPGSHYVITNLQAADSHGRGGAKTWYRFDMPPNSADAFRGEVMRRWRAVPGHAVHDGRWPMEMMQGARPAWWDLGAADGTKPLVLYLPNGHIVFEIATTSSGRVYMLVLR